MSMTISRKLAGLNGLKELRKELLMPQELHVPASRGYEKKKSTLVELTIE